MKDTMTDSIFDDRDPSTLAMVFLSNVGYGSTAVAARAFTDADPAAGARVATRLSEFRAQHGDDELTRQLVEQFPWLAPDEDDFWDQVVAGLTRAAASDSPGTLRFQPARASSFKSERKAQRAITEIFRTHDKRMWEWVESPQRRLVAELFLDKPVGIIVHRDGRQTRGQVAIVVATHEGDEVLLENYFLGVGRPDANGTLPSALHDALFQFLAGDLNEDFNDNYSSFDEAAAAFAAGYEPATVTAARDDFRVLRAQLGDTDELLDLLDQLGNGGRAADDALPDPRQAVTGYLDAIDAALDRAVTLCLGL